MLDYDHIAKVTGVERNDVKKLLLWIGYDYTINASQATIQSLKTRQKLLEDELEAKENLLSEIEGWLVCLYMCSIEEACETAAFFLRKIQFPESSD